MSCARVGHVQVNLSALLMATVNVRCDHMEKWRQMLSSIRSMARQDEHPHTLLCEPCLPVVLRAAKTDVNIILVLDSWLVGFMATAGFILQWRCHCFSKPVTYVSAMQCNLARRIVDMVRLRWACYQFTCRLLCALRNIFYNCLLGQNRGSRLCRLTKRYVVFVFVLVFVLLLVRHNHVCRPCIFVFTRGPSALIRCDSHPA